MNKQSEIQARYDAANTVQIKIKLNRQTDADIIARLAEQKSKQGYIKALIRKDADHEKINDSATDLRRNIDQC